MTVVDVPLALLAVAFLVSLVRVAIGPTIPDRAVATEVGLVTVVGAIALLAVRLGATHFLDAVIVATLLQFIATVALGRLPEWKERE